MFKINRFKTIGRILYVLVIVLIAYGQGACSSHKLAPVIPTVAKLPPRQLPPDAVPRIEPRSRYGNPNSYVVFGKRYYVLPTSAGFNEKGIASWYGGKFHGRRTSSGETYDMYAMTAAHKRLPLPTYVQVTNLKNGRQVVVRVNDRGPFHQNRIIDLSYSAAAKLGIIRKGTGLVEVQAIDPGNYQIAQTLGVPATVGKSSEQAYLPVSNVKPQAQMVDHQRGELQWSSTTTSAVNPRVFVQVGTFSKRANADQLLNRLSHLDIGAVTIASIVKDKKRLHRVRIGPFSTFQSADDTVVKLNDLGMQGHHVVIE